MSSPKALIFAAEVAGMSDDELFQAFQNVKGAIEPNEFERAVLDEAEFRGILTASEVVSISESPKDRVSKSFDRS